MTLTSLDRFEDGTRLPSANGMAVLALLLTLLPSFHLPGHHAHCAQRLTPGGSDRVWSSYTFGSVIHAVDKQGVQSSSANHTRPIVCSSIATIPRSNV